MTKPRIVVFDLGKVLVDFDFGIADVNLARHTASSPAEIHRAMHDSGLLLRYESGEITTREFYDELRAAAGLKCTLAEFAECFGGIFTPIPEMIEFHRQLRQNQVPTFIFSNTNELAVAWIRQRFPFFANFQGYIYSYEHQAMKPQERLYEVIEHASGGKSTDILYFDDRPENIATGAARGWHAVMHEQPHKSIAAARALGF